MPPTTPSPEPLAVIENHHKMKYLIRFIIFFLFVTNCSAQIEIEEFDIIGNWNSTDHWENESDFILSSDNYVSMSINGEFIDGKNNGHIGELKYSIDYEKDPIEMDLIAIKDNEEIGRILCSIKLINKNEFLMTISFDGKRDTDFTTDNSEKIITVKRKE